MACPRTRSRTIPHPKCKVIGASIRQETLGARDQTDVRPLCSRFLPTHNTLFTPSGPWRMAKDSILWTVPASALFGSASSYLRAEDLYFNRIITQRSRPRLMRSAFIFSRVIAFWLRRDSEIRQSQKSSNTTPYFLRSIWTATLRPFSSVTELDCAHRLMFHQRCRFGVP
jgi:hypothetical protein